MQEKNGGQIGRRVPNLILEQRGVSKLSNIHPKLVK